MTGLEPETCVILEIGCSVTDSNLKIIAEGPVFAIHHSERILTTMDPWSQEQHGKSGLTARCQSSNVSLAEAEKKTLEFLKKHCVAKASPLCGNSIGQDRRFLFKYMATLNEFFHYRNVDVSSIKELARRWYPKRSSMPEKKKTHYVLDDIRDSIEELKYYRREIFK